MATQAPSKLITIEEFERDYADKRYEYVAGRLEPMGPVEYDASGEEIVVPPKLKHGIVIGQLNVLITNYLREHPIGVVLGAETGFVMRQDPLEIRAADVAYVTFERLQTSQESRGWLPFPPDLAVEVVSDYDLAAKVKAKAQRYMANGTKLLWIAYPDERSIEVYQPGQAIKTLSGDDILDGGNVLPGFSTAVKAIFAPLDAIKGED